MKLFWSYSDRFDVNMVAMVIGPKLRLFIFGFLISRYYFLNIKIKYNKNYYKRFKYSFLRNFTITFKN